LCSSGGNGRKGLTPLHPTKRMGAQSQPSDSLLPFRDLSPEPSRAEAGVLYEASVWVLETKLPYRIGCLRLESPAISTGVVGACVIEYLVYSALRPYNNRYVKYILVLVAKKKKPLFEQ
jgi:hypothetical protein